MPATVGAHSRRSAIGLGGGLRLRRGLSQGKNHLLMRSPGGKSEMSDSEFHDFLSAMVTDGCVDVRVLTQAILKKFGGEQGLADTIYANYIASEGSAQATNFSQIMKLIGMGIEKDKERNPIDDLSQDQLHRVIKKFVKTPNAVPPPEDGRRLDPDTDLPIAEGGPEPHEPEDGPEASLSFAQLVDSVRSEIGLGDGIVQPSTLRARLPFLCGETKDSQGVEPSGEDA